MARKSFVLLVVGTVVFFLCSISSADVPHMINYQGKLTRTGGGPVNGTFDMTFSIYPDSVGSSADWTETQAQVEVEHGIFSVLLGSVNPIPASLFDGSVKYLGVQVESDPEMTPLKPMVTAPYAFRSLASDTAEYARVAPTMPDDDWVISGVNIYRLDGNIGVGTASPRQKLDVTEGSGGKLALTRDDPSIWGGTILGEIMFYGTDGGDQVGAEILASGGGEWTPGSSAADLRFLTTPPGSTVPQDRVIIAGSGNVGVGTMNPGQMLSVAGTIESTSGGFKFPDGSVQTTATSVGGISIKTGSANHEDLITPPGGYTVAQCKCIVSPRAFGPMGSSSEGYSHWCYVTEESGGWRVYARSRNTVYGHYLNDSVNYMVIGTK